MSFSIIWSTWMTLLAGPSWAIANFISILIWVLAFELAGTPFGYHKLSGGISLAFVGYQLQYDSCEVGISDNRVNATSSGTVGKLPQRVILTMLYLKRQLASVSYMVSAKWPSFVSQEIFRTDAKCEDKRVVLAGWEVNSDPRCSWFRIVLTSSEAPYLFQG